MRSVSDTGSHGQLWAVGDARHPHRRAPAAAAAGAHHPDTDALAELLNNYLGLAKGTTDNYVHRSEMASGARSLTTGSAASRT